MDWIHLEVGLPDHPKVGRLSRRLQIDRDRALAIVIRLLCWTARAKEDGHLNGTDPEDIAEVCRYDGDPDALVRSLVASGWLDEEEGALTVHDWMDRQGRLLKARERERARRAAEAPVPSDPVPQRGAACDTLPQRAAACGERRGEEREEREERKEKTSAETFPVSPPPVAVFTFPTNGKADSWTLTEPYLAELQELFPNLDARSQCRLALAWVKANPEKRKTARGMPAFLTRWLTNQTDSPKQDRRPAATAAPTPKTYRAWEPPDEAR